MNIYPKQKSIFVCVCAGTLQPSFGLCQEMCTFHCLWSACPSSVNAARYDCILIWILLCISVAFSRNFSEHRHSEMYWVPVPRGGLQGWPLWGEAAAAGHGRFQLVLQGHTTGLTLSARLVVSLWKRNIAKNTGQGGGGNKKGEEQPCKPWRRRVPAPQHRSPCSLCRGSPRSRGPHCSPWRTPCQIRWVIPEGDEACGEPRMKHGEGMRGNEQQREAAGYWLCCWPPCAAWGEGVWRLWGGERKDTAVRLVFLFVCFSLPIPFIISNKLTFIFPSLLTMTVVGWWSRIES